jgi:hypothetical protein
MPDERDEKIKNAVPPPPELLARIRGLKGKWEGKKPDEVAKLVEDKPPDGGASPPDR